MATMNLEIISKEIIRPSSPTPHNLRNHKLSFLDQLAPTTYTPIILYYHAKKGHDVDRVQKSSELKKSLEQTLNRFYPLAGSVKEDNSIECNDEGVEYYEALVACKLSEALHEFNAEILNKFLPFEPFASREVLLAVQCNFFDCGGVAIGVCISHRIADGASAATFLGAWSDTSRGVAAAVEAVCPNFDAAAMYFPPKEISWGKGDLVVTKDKIVTRRLVFDKSNIAALKDKAFSVPKLPTRVEPVSAFIWKRLMAISKSKPAPVRVHVAIHVVNLRERTVPPMPMHSIGNLVYSAVILSTHDDHDSHGILVNKLSNAIRGINGDYVKKLHRGMILDSLTKGVKLSSEGGMEIYKFSAWCRFPLYETDFGWGEPTSWVCLPAVPIKNQVYLLSTRDGHGIEAFVNILEEDAPVFDGDPELLPFMSCKIGD